MAETLPAAVVEAIRAALGRRARLAEPLARHTSYRIGGPAELLVLPESADELAAVLRAATAHGARVTLLGGGSNVLVGDGGIAGVVVKLGRGFGRVEWSAADGGERVRAGASVQLGRLARAAVARGLAGLEFAEGIPGTVGGALFMNAGAYGADVAPIVEEIEGLGRDGAAVRLDAAEVDFGYRRAHLPAGFVV